RNVLVTPDAQPVLIDFGNAAYLGRSWLAKRVLVPALGIIDRSAILKFRHRDFPELLSKKDRFRYRLFRMSKLLWPFGRLWHMLGLNHTQKRRDRARAELNRAETITLEQ